MDGLLIRVNNNNQTDAYNNGCRKKDAELELESR